MHLSFYLFIQVQPSTCHQRCVLTDVSFHGAHKVFYALNGAIGEVSLQYCFESLSRLCAARYEPNVLAFKGGEGSDCF